MTDPDEPERRYSPEKQQGREISVSILGVDTVRFTGHALLRMTIRKIKENQVLEAIRNPTRTGLPTQPGRVRVRKNLSNYKAIEVVYELWEDMLVVVTAFIITRGNAK